MFIKNQQINRTTAGATTRTPTTKGFNRTLFPCQRDVAFLQSGFQKYSLPPKEGNKNNQRTRKEPKPPSPISQEGESEGTGVFLRDMETFRGDFWPRPRAPGIQVFPFGTAGTCSLIQVEADSALAGELCSADI